MMMHKNMSDKDMAKHMKMMAGKMLLLGVLVLLNDYYMVLNWATFVGALLVICGLVKMIMPCCKK